MAFVSYQVLYQEALDALSNRRWESYFIYRIQNNRDMETTYTRLDNITNFIDWLKDKAAEETNGASATFSVFVGGN